FFDVRERQSTVGIGDIDNLIEPRDRVTHVLCVGQWFFALLRKRVDAVWQVTLRREQPVFLVRFPSCFRHVFTILILSNCAHGPPAARLDEPAKPLTSAAISSAAV